MSTKEEGAKALGQAEGGDDTCHRRRHWGRINSEKQFGARPRESEVTGLRVCSVHGSLAATSGNEMKVSAMGVQLESGCLGRAGAGIQAQTRGDVGGKDKSIEP